MTTFIALLLFWLALFGVAYAVRWVVAWATGGRQRFSLRHLFFWTFFTYLFFGLTALILLSDTGSKESIVHPLIWVLFKALLLGLAAGVLIVFIKDLVRRRWQQQRRFRLSDLLVLTTLVALLLTVLYFCIHLN
jgi:hypothetical protein